MIQIVTFPKFQNAITLERFTSTVNSSLETMVAADVIVV